MTVKTIHQHAAEAAEKIARGQSRVQAHSAIVKETDLTIGECSALRNCLDAAILDRLRAMQKALDEIALSLAEHPEGQVGNAKVHFALKQARAFQP